MTTRVAAVGLCAAVVFCATTAPAWAEPMDAGKALTKVTRGFMNVITGWVEIPKRINETTQQSGAAAGFTWGLLRGIGYGFIRTAAGAYEFITFPFPAPPGYEPIIQPEYIFTDEASSSRK